MGEFSEQNPQQAPGGQDAVDPQTNLTDFSQEELLMMILTELRKHSTLLAMGFGIKEDDAVAMNETSVATQP